MFSDDFSKYVYSDYQIVGVCAHELSHYAIYSGMTVEDICCHFDTDARDRVYATLDMPEYSMDKSCHLWSNEYLTDAAAISRGFAYPLYIHHCGLSPPYMQQSEIDTWWRV